MSKKVVKTEKVEKKTAFVTPMVCADRQRHTCIEISRSEVSVSYIALSKNGVELFENGTDKFDNEYLLRMPDYPIDKAARNFVNFARNLGASNEAMQQLAKLIPEDITKEIKMATTKKETSATKVESKKKPAQKAMTQKDREAGKKAFFGQGKTETPAKTTKSKPAAKPAAKAATKPAAKGEKKESASQMFKNLIMEGKLTDEQIFKKVQAKFGLDDNKSSYVKWYRNDLVKKGMKPPAAKS